MHLSRRSRLGSRLAALLLALPASPGLSQSSQFLFDATGNLFTQNPEASGLPQILGQPQMQVVIPGQSASFSVVVADASNVSYQWYFISSAIAGATSDSLLITNVGTNNQGFYWVVVANASGSTASGLANLYLDSRGCGMPDSWQLQYFGNLDQNPLDDYDGDGVSNLQEFLDGTNPTNAASALYRISLVNDGGTVVISPNASAYPYGAMVTLTATSSNTTPFHAWTGDVTTRSNAITVAMTNNLNLFAHFLPFTLIWTNNLGGDWNVAANWLPNLAPGSNESVIIRSSYPGTTFLTITENSNVDLVDFTLGDSLSIPTLTGSGRISIAGRGIWNAGTMSGTGATVVQQGASLNLTSSGLALNRTLENAGSLAWVGGDSTLGGVVTNDAGAQFQLTGSALFNEFDNAGTLILANNAATTFIGPFNDYGTVDFPGGTLTLSGGGMLANALDVPAGSTLNLAEGVFTSSGNLSITGAGNFLFSGGSGTLGGTVNVTGTNVFGPSGNVDFMGNYICTNNTMLISGASASFDGTGVVSPTLIDLSGGALGGAQTVTALGALSWSGGAMTGTGRTIIPPGVTLTINAPSAYIAITSRTLDNGGTILWSGGLGLTMTGGVITNEPGALCQVQSPQSISGNSAARFDNAGIFRATGAGTTTFSGVAFDNYHDTQIQAGTLALTGGGLNNGTMEVPAGTTLNLGGLFTSSAGSTITGAGNFTVSFATATLSGLVNLNGTNTFNGNSTAELNGNYICTNNTLIISGETANFDGTGTVAPATLTLSSGNLGGSNVVTVGNAMNWTGGAMIGTGRTIIPSGATLSISSSSPIFITSRTLDNEGVTTWTGSGLLSMNGGVITNEPGALFQVQTPTSISGAGRFDNAGIFRAAPTAGTTSLTVAFNNYNDTQIQAGTLGLTGGGLHNGTMEVPAGTTLTLGGAFTSSAGSTITGAGNFTVSFATATLSGLVNLSGTNTFTGNSTAELNGNYICTNNTLIISGDTANFDGTGTVAPATLTLSSGTLGGSNAVTVGSSMNWTGGSMSGTGRTVISPGATLTIANPSFLTINNRTLDNGGTAIWTGAGNINLNAAVITNRIGALFNAQNSSPVFFGGGSPRFDNAGTFRKSVSTGTTIIGGSVPFTNYGTVDIQSGLLAMNGGYASTSNAWLNCGIGGKTPGTNYGQLQVSGTVVLQGNLSLNFTNGYFPTTNDSFTLVTAGTRSNTFANFTYPSNIVTLQLSNTASSVIAQVTGAVSAPPPPVFMPPLISGSNVLLTWMANSNFIYRLEYNPALSASNWSTVPGDVTTASNTASKLDSLSPSNRFYRVQVFP